MNQYKILLNVLDQLRSEAPASMKKYYPLKTESEKLNQARSRAFIHLFLKVKFGISNFMERENLITDDTMDAGVDAYFIDEEHKKVFFIQSKFRTNEKNFQEKVILYEEILNMEVDRIIDGHDENEDGAKYNNKIKKMLKDISNIPDIGRFKYEVIIIANLKNINQSKIRKLTGGLPATVFNYEKSYNELLFPVICGTYYNQDELKITLNLTNKTSQSAKISYNVKTKFRDCEITVVFVPTLEIAKTMNKFRNSILKFNPRSFLELSNNTVNKEIASTILDLTTNEFALYNNGITMLSYDTEFNEKIGQRDKAQLIITKPQIINGGQTAYTLSRLYEENLETDNLKIFENKEVLLKIITISDVQNSKEKQLELIESISKATNQQTPVEEADRRSNDKIQIEMQEVLFENYGYFYERKRGEYADGIKDKYISRNDIIDRDIFIRICKACDGKPSEARRSSSKQLFKEDNFSNTLYDVKRYREYFFAYLLYERINEIEKQFHSTTNNKYGAINFGNALRYGKFAVITASMFYYNPKIGFDKSEVITNYILKTWKKFENHISKLKRNNIYFINTYDYENKVLKQELNFDGYYKGRNVNNDLNDFFSKVKIDNL